jgi:hypothetical protein
MSTKVLIHPFRGGVQGLLEEIVSERLAKKFRLDFEVERYQKYEDKSIWKQGKAERYVMEVRYIENAADGNEYEEYITDLYSWESKEQTKIRLIKGITKAYLDKKIGNDWVTKGDRLDLKDKILAKGVL